VIGSKETDHAGARDDVCDVDVTSRPVVTPSRRVVARGDDHDADPFNAIQR
jgi:hypothetical protein